MMFIWYKEIAKKHNFQCVSYMYIQACTKRTVCSSTFTGEIFQTMYVDMGSFFQILCT